VSVFNIQCEMGLLLRLVLRMGSAHVMSWLYVDAVHQRALLVPCNHWQHTIKCTRLCACAAGASGGYDW
jgi:hypothetical protein